MDRQHQILTEIQDQENHKNEVQQTKHGAQPNPAPSSSSSSPSHEFSFTISLNPTATKIPEKSPPPFPAIDLSPADEIFFHGHLLPLHLLSHLQTISPRSSTNSLDSFTLPINKVPQNNPSTTSQESSLLASKSRRKSKSFSLFGLPRRRKQNEATEKQEDDHDQGQKRKPRFDVSRVLKRYMRLVKPLLVSFRNRRRPDSSHFHGKNYSFSGNLRMRSEKGWRGRGGAFSSAPASMNISPTNSGLLVASGSVTPTSTKNDSTMEELQAAIQAAIAHCKKSIGQDDQIKLP